MQVIESFTATTKGDKIEDLIVETPNFFGIFDGVTGTKENWLENNKTMGQWGSFLCSEALKELSPDAKINDFISSATQKISDAKEKFGLLASDRMASMAIILPKRKPLEIWSVGDSHYGYKTKDDAWHSFTQNKHYDDVTLAYREIVVTQEILEKGEPQNAEERAHIVKISWACMQEALTKQMLLANHPDPDQKLGFGMLTGTKIPPHHFYVHSLPEDVTEIVLCSDGLPEATLTGDEGKALIKSLHNDDPFLIGKNPRKFMGFKGGFVRMDGTIADYYDDVAYLRVAV